MTHQFFICIHTGLLDCIMSLIGLGADGASVNAGYKTGVQAQLRDELPWLVYVWCVAHRLELAIKDAMDGTSFDKAKNIITD